MNTKEKILDTIGYLLDNIEEIEKDKETEEEIKESLLEVVNQKDNERLRPSFYDEKVDIKILKPVDLLTILKDNIVAGHIRSKTRLEHIENMVGEIRLFLDSKE